MSERARYLLAAIGAVLWLASFFLPAFRFGADDWETGWAVAATGWAGPLVGQFGWYANAIMIPSLGMLALAESPGDFARFRKLGAVLFLLWVNSWFLTAIPGDPGPIHITALGTGYYAWMASLLTVWGGLFFLIWRRSMDRRAESEALETDDGAGAN